MGPNGGCRRPKAPITSCWGPQRVRPGPYTGRASRPQATKTSSERLPLWASSGIDWGVANKKKSKNPRDPANAIRLGADTHLFSDLYYAMLEASWIKLGVLLVVA